MAPSVPGGVKKVEAAVAKVVNRLVSAYLQGVSMSLEVNLNELTTPGQELVKTLINL